MLYTNQRLTYSHNYSEMMSIKELNCRDVISDHKTLTYTTLSGYEQVIKYKHKTHKRGAGGGDMTK